MADYRKKTKIFFAQWKLADVRRFTADSLHSQQRFDFSIEGLRLQVYGLGLTALGLRLQVYGQKATRHLRTPCLRAKMIGK